MWSVAEPGDNRPERVAVGLRLRLSYGNLDEFVERFAVNISHGGVFIRSRDPKPVGTVMVLEIYLSGGQRVIRGKGIVRWISAEDPQNRTRPPGMGVEFLVLDAESRPILERLIAQSKTRLPAPATPATPTVTPPPGPPVLTPTPGTIPTARPAVFTPTPGTIPTAHPAVPTLSRAPPSLSRAAPPTPGSPRPPTLTPPTPDKAAPMPAQADLSASHRVEKLQAGPMALDTGLPAAPEQVFHPSRFVIGIDLGTTNSCAAVVRAGKPYVVPSREGHNIVPSVVALNVRNQIVVGHAARTQLLVNPRNTVYGSKRLIGRPFDSQAVQEIKSKFAYEIVADAEGLSAVRLGPETLSLEQIAALVLKELKVVARDHLGEEVNRAVITVPAYYSERQRAAVRNAGALAGFKVERILNEPTAAALAYAYGRRVQQRIMVYDLGGGTFDASVLELHDNIYEVVSTGGDTFLGGVDFDNRITDRLLELYEEQAGRPFDGDRVALSRLVDAAERAKCALSESTAFAIQLPFLTRRGDEPIDFEALLSRNEIVRLVEPLVDRTLAVCRDVLAARSLEPGDVDEVILVGGQSRMPLVHQKVEAFFGRTPSRAVHPDEAVAVGAALLAQSLGSPDGVVLIDVLPMSICIGLPGGRVKHIIERNTSLPAHKQYNVTTTHDGQREFELVVLQGEGPDAADCEYLGTLHLTGLPAGPRGMIKIAITFEVGAEGLLTVSAREQHSHREVRAVMSTRDGTEAIRRKLASQGPDAIRPSRSSTPAPPPAELTPAPEAIPAQRPASASSEHAPAADPPRRRGLFRRFFE